MVPIMMSIHAVSLVLAQSMIARNEATPPKKSRLRIYISCPESIISFSPYSKTTASAVSKMRCT
jgi:hypothetical protein